YIGGRDQPNFMTKLGEQTGPMMRSTTCLQRYRATRLGCEEIQQLSPRDPLAEYRSTPPLHSVSMKNIPGDIQTDYDSLRHRPLPQVVLNTSTLAHQCRRGRPPHHKFVKSMSGFGCKADLVIASRDFRFW